MSSRSSPRLAPTEDLLFISLRWTSSRTRLVTPDCCRTTLARWLLCARAQISDRTMFDISGSVSVKSTSLASVDKTFLSSRTLMRPLGWKATLRRMANDDNDTCREKLKERGPRIKLQNVPNKINWRTFQQMSRYSWKKLVLGRDPQPS